MVLFNAVFNLKTIVQPNNVHTRVATIGKFVVFLLGHGDAVVRIAHRGAAPALSISVFKPLVNVHTSIIHTVSATSGENSINPKFSMNYVNILF